MAELKNTGRKRLLKSVLATATPALLFLAVSVSDSSVSSEELQACVCDGKVSYSNNLPASHPKNRCATERQDVSWFGWLTGKNGTSQFHFVDLFELLYKKHNKPTPPQRGLMDE
ncbi:hypothetical protein L2725_16280 [Shewanella corallii]|uniref:Uncharacterized protein n=1 Tax=Shewanella corallii TaxID=560080 RepID=A0ABT0NB09_9GAMM|nr:hypothetical protein [Shewanella corallii]MCL2915320.1 hypothetical protein [Shewanella corallii]